MKENAKILDVCCGGKMFWFDKNNPNVIFNDIRSIDNEIIWKGKGRREGQKAYLNIKPDTMMDFRNLDFLDNSFNLVIFDPPHIIENTDGGWQKKKYGRLSPETWEKDIRKGFSECFRVLKPYGILIFKWCEIRKTVSEVIKLTPVKPLIGHKSGKQQKTHWVCFMKLTDN